MKLISLERLGGIILAAALALGLAACSAVKLGYNSLPSLAYWWLDGYVDLHDGQSAQVRADLDHLVAWHRQHELPQIADLLARMERMAPGDITPQQACAVFDEARTRLAAVGEHLEPDATTLAQSLDAQQLQHLERKFRRNDESYFHDWLAATPQEQRERAFKKALERFEMVYGRLDEPQRAVLRERIAQVPYEASRVLAERRRRQGDLLQVLRKATRPGVTEADARALLHGWLDRAEHSPDAAFRAWQDDFVQEGCRTFAAVHRSTTAAQRQQAVHRLRAYERDVRELMAQPQ